MWDDFKSSFISTIVLFVIAFFVFRNLNGRFEDAFVSHEILWYVMLASIGWIILLIYLSFKAGMENSWGCAIAFAVLFAVNVILPGVFGIVFSPMMSLSVFFRMGPDDYNVMVNFLYLVAIILAFIIGWLKGRTENVVDAVKSKMK